MIEPLVLAAALFSPDMSEPRRMKALRAYFDPAPGEALALDEAELRDQAHKKPDDTLRGFITIDPPKGKCFTIIRSEDETDDVVCKKTRLSFRLGDLDAAGRLHWRVSTGEGDFGTPLSWASPYRVATVLVQGKELTDDPSWRWIASCEAQRSGGERKITVRMAAGERWVIRLPDVDTPLGPDSDEPYLIVKGGIDNRNILAKRDDDKKAAKPEEKKESQDAAKPEEKKEGHDAEKKDEPGKEGEKAEPKKPEPPPKPDTSWYVPERGAYVMSADSFFATTYTTPGGPGICRYSYRGSRKEPTTGILECHDTDAFKVVVLPLTCLVELKP